MRDACRLLLTTLLMAITPYTFAEVYRWVDDQGVVEFSDEPREGAEKVDIGPTTTIIFPKPEPGSVTPPVTAPSVGNSSSQYSKLAIVFPQHDSAFVSPNGDVSVSMIVDPPLLPNHSLRLTMDGTTTIRTKENYHTFANVDRGTHQLQLDVIDNTSVVKTGPSISFTIHRPSVLRNN